MRYVRWETCAPDTPLPRRGRAQLRQERQEG